MTMNFALEIIRNKKFITTLLFLTIYISIRIMFIKKIQPYLVRKLKKKNIKIQEKDKLFLQKLTSTSWRCFYYSTISLYGLSYLIKSKWIMLPKEIDKPIKEGFLINLHYLIEFSHYLASTIFIFIEPKTKDFFQLLIHHFITLFLISFSYLKM